MHCCPRRTRPAKVSVQAELERMIASARADLKQRGVKDADKAPIPEDMFRPQAERRVRLGLVVGELVRANATACQAGADQGAY
jgi:trigger factor